MFVCRLAHSSLEAVGGWVGGLGRRKKLFHLVF